MSLESGSMTGTTVGRYEVLERVGVGGMGEVYRARDQRLDRVVALKAIAPGLTENANVRRRFVREGRVACRVSHPYVATVFDVLDEDAGPMLIMEFISGRTLHDLLRADEPDPARELAWCCEIAQALVAIHDSGLVHRDLKPGNVMITPDGHVKVLDFGLARTVEQPLAESGATTTPDESTITREGVGVGTLNYMSPEQVRGEQADQRSDLFAFGVLLWETITREHPFTRSTAVETAAAILGEPPGGGDVPAAFDRREPLHDLVLRLLHKDPAQRLASAAALVEELNRAMRGLRRRGFRLARHVALFAALPLVAIPVGLGYWWIRQPPVWDAPRYVLAIAPVLDRTAVAKGESAQMLGHLLSIDLESSKLVRVIPPVETAPLIRAADDTVLSSERIATDIGRGLEVDYVVVATLYREGASYVAAVDLARVRAELPEIPGLHASADRMPLLAERLATAVRRSLPEVSRLTAWRDDRVDIEELLSESDEARVAYYRGLHALSEERLVEAIDGFEEATRADPSFALAHSELGGALDAAGYGRRARDAAAKALALAPDGDSAAKTRLRLTIRAEWAHVYRRRDEALDAATRLEAIYPDEPRVLMLLARSLGRAEVSQALATMARARELDPHDARIPLYEATLLDAAGRREEALAVIDEAENGFLDVGNQEGIAAARMERGTIFWRQERYAEAGALLEEAARGFAEVGRDLSAAGARVQLAKLQVLRQDLATAEPQLRAALAEAQRAGNLGIGSDAYTTLAVRLMRDGKPDEAEQFYYQAIDLARQLDNDWLLIYPLANLGNMLITQGRLDEARPLFEEAAEKAKVVGAPDVRASALIATARVGERTGDLALARRVYEGILAEAGEGPRSRETTMASIRLALIDHWQGRMRDGLARAVEGVARYRKLSLDRDLATALIRRAKILSALGRGPAAKQDLAEIGRLAETAGVNLVKNHATTQVTLLLDEQRWKKALAEIDSALERDDPETDRWRCEALVRLGRHAEAPEPCTRAAETPGLPMADRIEARALLAEALLAANDTSAALAEARATHDAALAAGMPLAIARSATVLMRAGSDEVERVQRAGLGALEDYLSSIPEADRDRALRVRDLGRLQSILTSGSGTSQS